MRNRSEDKIPEEFIHIFMHLLKFVPKTYGQKRNIIHLLCHEVALITQGRALLQLDGKDNSDKASLFLLPVHYKAGKHERVYGSLSLAPDPYAPQHPALPYNVAHLIAQTCAWLLYTAETSALILSQCHHLSTRTHKHLTKREKEVLKLICLNYTQEQIASQLNITLATIEKHRQHIYYQLDVHSQQDAILKAYWMGYFSPLEALSTEHRLDEKSHQRS